MSLDTTIMVMSDIKPLLSNEYRSLSDGSGIICADDHDFRDLERLLSDHELLGVSHPWVVLGQVSYNFQVSLNRQIFFFDTNKSTLSEVYSVDGARMERIIGMIDEDNQVIKHNLVLHCLKMTNFFTASV